MEDLKNEVVEWIGGQMKGYKGMNMDMTCRGMQYEVGGTYRVDGEVELCRNGLHFCTRLANVFWHYPIDSSRYFEVEAGGTVVTDKVDGKSAASELTIVRELSEAEVNICRISGNGYGNGNGYGYDFGYGGGNGYGDGCGYGNGNGYGYGDGNDYGYGDGGGCGYGDGSSYGDSSGCGYGDGSGCGCGDGNGYGGKGKSIEYILKIK